MTSAPHHSRPLCLNRLAFALTVVSCACYALTPEAQAASRLSAEARDLLTHLARMHETVKSLRATVVTEARAAGGWITTQQQLSFAAPDRFRLVTTSTDDPLADKPIALSFGEESYLISERRRVAKRWARNLFLDWGNMPGGPANVASFGSNYKPVAAQYGGRVSGTETILDRPTTRLVLTANDPGMVMVRDIVNTDTTVLWTQFAVFRIPKYRRPPEVRLWIDKERGTILQREHHADRELWLRATATATKELAPGLFFPTSFEVFDRGEALVERVSYRHLELNPALDDGVFKLALKPGAVLEDAEPMKVSVYRTQVQRTPEAPSPRYNLGLALIRHQQDMVAALETLKALAERSPEVLAAQAELAGVLDFVGRPAEAAARYDALLGVDAAYPVHLELGRALLRARRPQAAAEALAKSPVASASSDLLVELATAALQQGKEDEAKAHCFAALKLPGAANATGRVAAARKLLAMALWLRDTNWLVAALADVPDCSGKSLTLGDLALFANAPEDALKHYQAAVDQAPEDMVLRYAIAHGLLIREQNAAAEKYLRQVISACPTDPIAVECAQLLAASQTEQGEFDAAAEVLEQATKTLEGQAAPGRERHLYQESAAKLFRFTEVRTHLRSATRRKLGLTALRVLGEMDRRLNDWEAAVATYENATRRFGSELFVSTELARAYVGLADQKAKAANENRFSRRDYREAEDTLRRLARSNPEQPYFWQLHVALLDRWYKQYDAAKILKEKLAAHPEDSDAHIAKASVRPPDNLAHPNPKPEIATLEKALALSLSRGSARYEEMLFARQLLANAYERDEQTDEAAYQLRTVLLSIPESGTRMTLRTTASAALIRMGDYDTLVDLAREVVEGDFEREERLAYLQQIARLSSAKEAAAANLVRYLDAQLDAHPKDPVLAQIVGEINVARKALPEALDAYQKACQSAPTDAIAWLRLAELQVQAQRGSEALASLEKAVEARPHEVRFRRAYALVLAKLKRVDDAAAQTRPLMLHSNADHRAFVALGDVLSACGNHKQAEINYRLAVRLAQYDTSATFEDAYAAQRKLASTLAAAEKPADAAEALRPLCDQPAPRGQRLACLFQRADYLKTANDLQAARDCLNQVIELAETDKVKEQAKRKLNELDRSAQNA